MWRIGAGIEIHANNPKDSAFNLKNVYLKPLPPNEHQLN
jgi:hypothetical protein